jgi:phage terminase Nu1 subunit (DNA packaging protein)
MLTGETRYEIDKWVQAGCPVVERPSTKGGEWRFDTAQVFAWRADAIRLEMGDGKPIDLNAERARLAKEQADGQALKNSVARGELLPADKVENAWMSAIGRCRALLLGIPTSSAGRIVLLSRQHEGAKEAEREVRELLTSLIDGAVEELRNTDFDDTSDDEGDGRGDTPVAA